MAGKKKPTWRKKAATKTRRKPKRRSRWVHVSDQVRELKEEEWETYWAEMSAAEAIKFIKDPKSPLLKEGLIKRDYRIEMHLVNPDVTVAGPVCQMMLIFPHEKLAIITQYRHPPGT